MNLKSRHKIDPSFNSAGMQDVIFLLLIFFILTSGSVSQSAMDVDSPNSTVSKLVTEPILVEVSKEGVIFVNGKEVTKASLNSELSKHLGNSNSGAKPGDLRTVVVKADKDITHNEAINIAAQVSELNVKVSFGVDPIK